MCRKERGIQFNLELDLDPLVVVVLHGGSFDVVWGVADLGLVVTGLWRSPLPIMRPCQGSRRPLPLCLRDMLFLLLYIS